MVYIQFLIPMFILGMAGAAISRSPFHEAVIEATNNLCPTASICRGNETGKGHIRYTSCCTDCSCEADCEQSRCCFPTSRRDVTMSGRTQCLYASTEQPREGDQHLFASYNMIVDTPEQGCAINSETREYSRTRSSWLGSAALQEFNPVFSKSSGKIFKNLQLASCYGEKHVLPWNPELVCKLPEKTNFNLDMSAYTLYIRSPKRYPFCEFNFYYPGDKADIERERCFINPIDTCANTTFEIPKDTSLTHDEIRSACESSLNSPHVLKRIYANVFCYICNGELFSDHQKCDEVGPDKIDAFSHVWLLRSDVTVSTDRRTADRASRRVACPSTKSLEHGCRTLFCPTGKIRTRGHRCVWPFIDVGHRAINLFVDLIPDQILTVDDIEDMLRNGGTEAFQENLINPWPKQWKLKRVQYLPANGGNASQLTLYVTFQIYTKEKHDKVLKTVMNNIKKKWRLRIGEVELEFEQRLSAQSELFIIMRDVPEEHFVFTDSNRTQFDIQQTKTIRIDGNGRMFAFKITKLFFCEQVALSADEFTTERNNRIIVLNQSRRVFLDGEFGLIEDNMQQLSARICLSDAKYVVRIFTSSFEISRLSPFLAIWGISLHIIAFYKMQHCFDDGLPSL